METPSASLHRDSWPMAAEVALCWSMKRLIKDGKTVLVSPCRIDSGASLAQRNGGALPGRKEQRTGLKRDSQYCPVVFLDDVAL